MPPSLETSSAEQEVQLPASNGEHADSTTNSEENATKTEDQTKENSTNEEPNAPRGSKCEIKSVVQRGDEVEEKEAWLSALNKKPWASFALVTKQVYEDFKLTNTLLEINSPHILSLLKKIVTYYPAEPLQFETQVSYEKPFKLLHQYREELESHAATSEDEEEKAHLNLLFEFMASEMGDNGPRLERMTKSGLITFDLLWAIFKPGDLIFQEEYGHERLYKLQKTGYQDSCTAAGKFLELFCEYSNCDGERAGQSTVKLQIWEKQSFVGNTPSKILSLSVVPLKFFNTETVDPEALKERLTTRGKRYLEIRGAQCFNYDGLFMYLKTPPYDHYDEDQNYDGIWLPRSGAGRVVVDCKTFVEEMRRQKEEMARWSAMFNKDAEKTKTQAVARQLDEAEDPMLCPPYVYGYNLALKEWCKFFINSLDTFEWTPNAMDSLIIPDAERKLIRSLVTAHRFPDQARDESLLKGKGLIILLHGEPGVGKTLTAELVAEHCKRPLLKISIGELGSWGETIADQLKEKLEYASIWKAVVLIDEADVFLEARKTGADISHNNMVALFLKQLEYYQGILFLTSNRVQVFDRAIRSRIHLALQYHSPDLDRRKLMWKQQLALLDPKDTEIDEEACLDQISVAEMNGREIANAVNTARTLASSDESKLRLEHLELVIKVWEGFHESLKKIEQENKEEGKLEK